MDTKIELYDYFQGFPIKYEGILRWQWDANGTQLIPSLPGDPARIQLIETTGLNIKSRSGYDMHVKLVDLSFVDLIPNAGGTRQQYVIKCAIYLFAYNVATTEETILDRWPEQLSDGWYIERARNYMP